MKAKLLQSTVLWTFLSVATLLVGCSDDEDYRDVDGQSPTLELTSDHIRTLTGYEFKIAGKIVDKDGIRSINLQCAELYLDKTIELLTLYSESLVVFPSDKTGTYTLVIRAVDTFGNVAEKNYSVLVSRVKDYENMYLVDFEGTDSKLLTGNDVWGVPMPIERVTNFTYKARCYSPAPNTPIRFITSKYSFSICFGDDKNNPGKLTGISEDVQPIILPEKSYYEINFNTEEGTYTVEAYSPGTPIIDGLKMGFVGGWFDGAKGWDGPKNVYELTQDPDNPHCLTAELTWSKQDSFDVTITPYDANGAWLEPGWRFDGKNESFATNTNDSSKKVPAGKYTFIFDTHLVQSKLLKK